MFPRENSPSTKRKTTLTETSAKGLLLFLYRQGGQIQRTESIVFYHETHLIFTTFCV